MSATRLTLSVVSVSLLVGCGGVAAIGAVPLYAAVSRPSPVGAGVGVAPSRALPALALASAAGQAATPPVPVTKVLPVYPAAAAAAGVSGPVVLRVTCDNSGTPTDVEPMAGAQELVPAAVEALRQWRFEPPAESTTFVVGVSVVPPGTATGPGRAPLRIGPVIKPPTKVEDARPIYPPDAREAGVQGVVILEVTIGPDGVILDARVLRSVEGLDAAALTAVLQWKYTPTLMNGQPVPVIMTVTVNFTLA